VKSATKCFASTSATGAASARAATASVTQVGGAAGMGRDRERQACEQSMVPANCQQFTRMPLLLLRCGFLCRMARRRLRTPERKRQRKAARCAGTLFWRASQQSHSGQWYAYEIGPVLLLPAGREVERPWITEHVHTPAAQEFAANATRKRPLIYVCVGLPACPGNFPS
jgi:hypothetical protein